MYWHGTSAIVILYVILRLHARGYEVSGTVDDFLTVDEAVLPYEDLTDDDIIAAVQAARHPAGDSIAQPA